MEMTMLRTKMGGAALAALVALAAGASLAAPYRHRDDPDRFQAQAPNTFAPAGYCIPANGAQVLGGYAAPGDLLDPVTGAICNPRHGFTTY
jgi:hypothetical protein